MSYLPISFLIVLCSLNTRGPRAILSSDSYPLDHSPIVIELLFGTLSVPVAPLSLHSTTLSVPVAPLSLCSITPASSPTMGCTQVPCLSTSMTMGHVQQDGVL
ncbi:hypothetical protein HETIRDRAFT_305885 [Heterobasidion irregulare TC 32-1]|uniref:Uncharacterized protein n=1 Tax=Heterobasidion irregulare (strain TC 32-1) TaxID=747525 RepID=W4KQ30_HETIT|nr:uncharacterized protein HETIRDRAFT_305885 [Heterobasidion irregulare TC 32-1]ETW87789.1 hypothetical protein HETIRDRAFT_305885 [Heterobasidion irregulare TC 32-1]